MPHRLVSRVMGDETLDCVEIHFYKERTICTPQRVAHHYGHPTD